MASVPFSSSRQRMLHWPDSMFSFLKEDGILFSSDAFGQHLASSERFDDEVDLSEVMKESAKYYAKHPLSFCTTYSKIAGFGCRNESEYQDDRSRPRGYLADAPERNPLLPMINGSRAESDKKALVIYDSMWHSTEEMAHAVSDGLLEAGVSTNMVNLQVHHRSDVMDPGFLVQKQLCSDHQRSTTGSFRGWLDSSCT